MQALQIGGQLTAYYSDQGVSYTLSHIFEALKFFQSLQFWQSSPKEDFTVFIYYPGGMSGFIYTFYFFHDLIFAPHKE